MSRLAARLVSTEEFPPNVLYGRSVESRYLCLGFN